MSFRFSLGLCLLVAVTGTAAAQSINEIRIDQPSSDNDEYVELAGEPGASLDGLTLIVIGDDVSTLSGYIEAVVPLTGNSIGASGYFVIAEPTFTLGTADLTTSANGLNFENDDTVTFFLVSDFTGAVNTDLDTDNDGVLDSTPWAEVIDRIAVIKSDNPPSGTNDYHYGPPTVGPNGSDSPFHVFRCPDSDPTGSFAIGANAIVDGDDTPGAANDCSPPVDAGVPDAALPDAALPDAGPDDPDAGPGDPDAGPGDPDAAPQQPTPDASTSAGGGGGSDGGCCSTTGQGTPGNLLLAMLVGLALVGGYRRRHGAR